MNSPSEALKSAVEQFCSPDEDTKREGYSKFFERVHAFVLQLLQKKTDLTASEREDLAAEAMARLWANRDRTAFQGFSKWWVYVAQTTNWTFVDYCRSKRKFKRVVEDPIIGDLVDESEPMDSILEVAEDRRAFYRLADEVFLGLPPELTDRERDRRLLAAKLILIDKKPWQAVCVLLNAGTSDDMPVTRPILDEWLSSPCAVRQLVYSELYWNNERLCRHVLTGEGAPRWTQDQIRAVELHVKFGTTATQIESSLNQRIKKSELLALFVRCRRRFPFIDIVKRLKRELIRSPYAKEELRAPGLWQRLVVQYHAREDLTAHQILDRIGAASAVAGYPVTDVTLNAALCSKRLQKKMADHLARRKGHAVSSSGR